MVPFMILKVLSLTNVDKRYLVEIRRSLKPGSEPIALWRIDRSTHQETFLLHMLDLTLSRYTRQLQEFWVKRYTELSLNPQANGVAPCRLTHYQ